MSIETGLRFARGILFASLAGGAATACTIATATDAAKSAPEPSGTGTEVTPKAPRTDGVVREIAYHQLTADKAHLPTSAPVISANGKRIAFAVAASPINAPNKIFVVDADGANLKEVDSYTARCHCGSKVAISDDGNTIVSTDSVQTRVVDVGGGLRGGVVLTDNEIQDVAIDATGAKAFFLARRDTALAGGGIVQRGLYRMNADGTDLTQVLGPAMVAPLVGKTEADVFPFGACGTSLAVSGDGSRAYAAVQVQGAQAIIGSDAQGARVVVGPVAEGQKLVFAVATSRDGTKVAYRVSSEAGTEIGVTDPSGGQRKKLGDVSGIDCATPVTLSSDGALLGLGYDATIHPTDGAEPWMLVAPTGAAAADRWFLGEPDGGNSREMTMSGDGKRFAYLSNDGVIGRHLAIAELDDAALGPVPTVSLPKITPASLPRDGKTTAFMQARVAPDALRVGGQVFLRGAVDNDHVRAQILLRDDGKNGDGTAGDGLWDGDGAYATPTATVGPRVVRIKAEGVDPDGRRTAHAIDFGPFAVR